MGKVRAENTLYAPGALVAFERQTGTDSSQAITMHSVAGEVTSSTTDLGTDTDETITITNRHVKAESLVFAQADGGGAGTPVVAQVTPTDGQVTVTVRNVDASNACDAAYKVRFLVFGDQEQEL